MKLGLEDKVALVAAASRGLGRATAEALSREGARVAIAARNEGTLQQAAREIQKATRKAVLPVQADLTVPEDIEKLVSAVRKALGPIEILVNNAGGPRPGVFTEMADEDWAGAVDLNLMSAVRLTRLVLPAMRECRWGRIINITSYAVKQPIPTLILSNTARAGVAAMAKTLAHQVAADNITVNNVCPGHMLTDRLREIARATAERENATERDVMAEWERAIPAGRLGRPEELASLIAYLASEQAGYITGATIQVDGGLIQGLL